jgi:hypothetical protein
VRHEGEVFKPIMQWEFANNKTHTIEKRYTNASATLFWHVFMAENIV